MDLHKKLQKDWVGARATAQACRALKPPLYASMFVNFISKTKEND